MIYRRRSSPLHAARAGAAVAWCAALAFATLLLSNPIVLGAVCCAVIAAGVVSGVGREMRRVALYAIPLALSIAVVNALVTREGLTTIARLGDLPILGVTDVTLQATVYGAILGLRAATLILCGALYSLAVDPDAVLGLMRGVSFRSALTVSIANRMVPILMRDSRRLADAQRCRPGRPPGRLALMRATTSGVLDRALDVAAALEVRGYGSAWSPSRSTARRPWSRHDIAFASSAGAITILSLGARIGGLEPLQAYPTLTVGTGTGTVAIAIALLVCALAPFAQWRGVQ